LGRGFDVRSRYRGRRPDLLDAPCQLLDHLWWQWYNSSRRSLQNLPLMGMDAVMDPWSYTEPDTRDIAALGYTYA